MAFILPTSALKMPKKKCLKCRKEVFKMPKLAVKGQQWHLNFMKWTPPGIDL